MILVIDNYDSFTYNLVQYLSEWERNIRVFRNDQINVNDILALKPDSIVLSPGPGYPKDRYARRAGPAPEYESGLRPFLATARPRRARFAHDAVCLSG